MRSATLTPSRLKAAGKAVALAVVVFVLISLTIVLLSEETRAAFARLPGWSLWAFATGVFFNNLLRLHRYVIFAARLGIHAPVRVQYLYLIAGTALIATPGKVGTALRLWLLHQRYKTPYRQSAPMLLMDMLTDFIAMLALILIAIALMGNTAGLGLALIAFIGLLAGLIAVFAFPRLPRGMVKILYNVLGRRNPRLFATLLRLLSKLKTLFGPSTILSATALSLAGWASLILGTAALAQGLQLPLNLAMLALVVCGGTMLGSLTMLPGGLGGTEATMLALLTTFGIPLSAALLLILIFRVGTLWLPTLIGFIVLPFALKHARS